MPDVVSLAPPFPLRSEAVRELAYALLEMHEQEAISLDTWVEAREVVEAYCGPIEENGI